MCLEQKAHQICGNINAVKVNPKHNRKLTINCWKLSLTIRILFYSVVRNFSLQTSWIWISVAFAFKLPWCRSLGFYGVMWLLLSSARRYITPIMFVHLFLFELSFRDNLHSQMAKIVGLRSWILVLSSLKFFRLHFLRLLNLLIRYGKIIRYGRAC